MSDQALDLMAALVLEDGRRWGDAAVDVQRDDAAAVLDQSSVTPYHFLTRARGFSKTADLAGVAVAAMLAQAPARSKLYAAAADRDQARLFADSIAGYQARTPELSGALKVDSYRVTAERSGASLEILAADAPGAWGLRPWFLLLDEVAQWPTTTGPRLFLEALTSAVAKIAGARMVALTTAGDPAHPARRLLEHGLRDPLWRVHEVGGPPPWMQSERVAEQQRRLPESSFRRLFLNEWTAAEDRLVSPDDLAACTVLDGPLAPESHLSYVIGVDLGLTNDATACVVAHAEKILDVHEVQLATRVVVDRLEVWQGQRDAKVQIADVEDWLALTAASYRAKVVCDPWQMVGSAQRLRSRGVRIEEFPFSSQSVGRLASTLHLLLRNRALALPNDEALLDELRNVRLRETAPGVMRIDHDPSHHDDRAIALALACVQLLAGPSTGAGSQPYRLPVGGDRDRYVDTDTNEMPRGIAAIRSAA